MPELRSKARDFAASGVGGATGGSESVAVEAVEAVDDAEASIAILDAHVHVWDQSLVALDWVRGSELDGARLPAMIDAPDAVTSWIAVEADAIGSPIDEVDWLAELGWSGLAGVVADIELDDDTVHDQIAELASRELVVGARHLLQDLPDARIEHPAFARGLWALADAELAFDVCARWQQLDAVRRLAAEAPATRIVLDHLGKPPVDAGLASLAGIAWHEALLRLAELDNVFVKLSGLPAESADIARAFDEAQGFLGAAIDAFGPARCMVASDWPVSVGASGMSSPSWFEAVQGVAGSAWPQIAAATARAFYRLG